MENFNSQLLEKILGQFFSTFEKVSKLVEKGVGVYVLTLGALVIGITIALRIFRIDCEYFTTLTLTQADFIVLIVAGTLVLILGGGIKVYEQKSINDRYKWQLEFSANSLKLQKDIGENTQNKIADSTARLSNIEPPKSVL